MAHYDVFNGDADGICALQQLRLAQPRRAVLVTGVKRDIALLGRVPAAAGDTVTVLDISLARNRAAVDALLARGAALEYFDHHHAGTPPVHPRLVLHLDPAPGTCTSAIVDRHLGGRHRLWAVVGAFGDNLAATALALAHAAGLDAAAAQPLRVLGEAINYNAYGDSEADLLLAPADLYRAIAPHADPFAFAGSELAHALAARQAEDFAQAQAAAPVACGAAAAAYLLPDAPWARRVQGIFANHLNRAAPQRAHAVLRPAGPGTWNVSVRAPQHAPHGADTLCLSFEGGGGRAAAAGIDHLPHAQLDAFLTAFAAAWPG